jgi:hypothetical protein
VALRRKAIVFVGRTRGWRGRLVALGDITLREL